MASFISWLDHSEEDQRRVREMLQLFSDKDTVDDLGIGTVRDAISNALFPGTSIIQTRARYFLFIPWLFRQAERRHPQQSAAIHNNSWPRRQTLSATSSERSWRATTTTA